MATHCVHCSDEKPSVFMKKNGPNLNQIHEETLVNDCPATVCDMIRFIKIDLSDTSIFDGELDPPPTWAIVTKKIFKDIPELR